VLGEIGNGRHLGDREAHPLAGRREIYRLAEKIMKVLHELW
jgi:hypothetical protein